VAQARDGAAIEVRIPEDQRTHPVAFLARLENVMVEPDRRAKVVINERTGTLVAGGDVRIARVAVSHGDLRVSIASETSVSQPGLVGVGSFQDLGGVRARTAVITNSRVDVDEGAGFVMSNNTVADLVHALVRLKTNTRDVISILRAVKAAGALHAELVVQ
jgi:flagellar P-ring protein precursor FlgI